MKKEKTFTFRLISNKIISYSENSMEKNGINPNELKNVKTYLEVKLGFNIEKEIIGFLIKTDFFYGTGENKIDLINIETVHQFKVIDFKKHFEISKDNKVNIPDQLMSTFLGIAISGTRGMLTASIKSQEYKNFIIPLMDIKKMIEQLKTKD